ncbi:MAG: N-6 DNA methylase [Candidatus Hodarchaeales archaeon]
MQKLKDKDQFSEFINQLSPFIRRLIHNIEESPELNSGSEASFRRIFFSETETESDQRLDSKSELIAVLVYDFLNIGFRTYKTTGIGLGQELKINSISVIIKTICDNNVDIPIFHSSIFPLHSLLEFFLSYPPIFNVCVKYLLSNTLDSINYTEMKLPYFFDRNIGHYQKQVLGQVFTPIPIADFIFRQVINSETEIIIDPAAGTGVFLLRALKNIIRLNYTGVRKIIAIEKDPLLSLICESAIKIWEKIHPQSIECKIYNQDLFASGSFLKELRHEEKGVVSILMNPPYTRQESIPAKEKEFIKNQVTSTNIISRFMQKFNSYRISGQSSLYIYFVLFISEFLNTRDKVGIIIPNSWMDVRYGSMLQQFLLEYFYIDLIITTNLEKLIPSVDVNTAIMTLKMKSEKEFQEGTSSSHQVKFIRINSITDLELITDSRNQKALSTIANCVYVPVEEGRLLLESKWGLFTKAPKFYLDYLDSIKSEKLNLKDYASVRRGFTSGANDFFYVGKPGKANRFFISSVDPMEESLILKPINKDVLERLQEQGFLLESESFRIEREYWMHSVKIDNQLHNDLFSNNLYTDGDWIPNYLIKSPKELDEFEITSEKLHYIVLIVPKEKQLQLKPGIREYIRWGEIFKPSKGSPYALRITCANRKYWYSLPEEYYQFCPILCIMTINDRYPFFFNPKNYYFDARFYGITPQNKISNDDGVFTAFLFLFLNTVFVSLQIEVSGRRNLGEGGLDVKVYEYQDIKIPPFNIQNKNSQVFTLFQKVVQSTPFSYLKKGLPSSKQDLNRVLKEFCSFSDDFLVGMHESLLEIVQARIEKSKTDFSFIS